MRALLAFLPEEFLILIPIGIGFLVMFRILSLARAVSLLATICVFIALFPFLESLLDTFPFWVLVLLMFFIIYSMFQSLCRLVLGKGVADHFIGRLVFAGFVLPFRIIGWILRTMFRRTI